MGPKITELETLNDVVKVSQTRKGYFSAWAQYYVLAKDEKQRSLIQENIQEKRSLQQFIIRFHSICKRYLNRLTTLLGIFLFLKILVIEF